MQRRATLQSRGANSDEKKFMRWIKDRGICSACKDDGGVICHHFAGATAKIEVNYERIHFGHWAVNGLCLNCDNVVTHKSRPTFRKMYGNESDIWIKQIEDYPYDIPLNIISAIIKYGK